MARDEVVRVGHELLRDGEVLVRFRPWLTMFSDACQPYIASTLGQTPTVAELAVKYDMFASRAVRKTSVSCVSLDGGLRWALADECRSFEDMLVVPWSELVDDQYRDALVVDCVDPVRGRLSSDLVELPGWCYKALGHADCDEPWPTVAKLRQCGVDEEELRARLVRVAPGYCHVSGAGVRDTYDDLDVVGAPVSSVVSALDVASLRSVDPRDCRCRVHAAPRVGYAGVVAGCALVEPGGASVIRAAASGVSRYCHAEEYTRVADHRMALYVASDPQVPGIGVSKLVPEAVRSFESAGAADMKSFGRGYCYLRVVFPTLRWRVARILGPNPLCADVLKVYKVCVMADFKAVKFVELCDGWYHLAVDSAIKGVSVAQGKSVIDRLCEIVARDPVARVGASVGGVLLRSEVSGEIMGRYLSAVSECVSQVVECGESTVRTERLEIVRVPLHGFVYHIHRATLVAHGLTVSVLVMEDRDSGEVLGFVPCMGNLDSSGYRDALSAAVGYDYRMSVLCLTGSFCRVQSGLYGNRVYGHVIVETALTSSRRALLAVDNVVEYVVLSYSVLL